MKTSESRYSLLSKIRGSCVSRVFGMNPNGLQEFQIVTANPARIYFAVYNSGGSGFVRPDTFEDNGSGIVGIPIGIVGSQGSFLEFTIDKHPGLVQTGWTFPTSANGPFTIVEIIAT